MEGYAYFARRPGRLEDLRVPHPLEAEKPYRVVGEMVLGDMDFQNFLTDLYADRDFLEEYAPLCGRGEEWACLLVRCAGDRNGILVVPERRYVEWAALVDTGP